MILWMVIRLLESPPLNNEAVGVQRQRLLRHRQELWKAARTQACTTQWTLDKQLPLEQAACYNARWAASDCNAPPLF